MTVLRISRRVPVVRFTSSAGFSSRAHGARRGAVRLTKLGARGLPGTNGEQGPQGIQGPPGDLTDPGDFTLIFNNGLV
jgi:hypothetical protein